MIYGIGTDILSIQRIRTILESDYGEGFINSVFTEKEQAQAAHDSDPTLYYAERFSGKEAVFKSLGGDWGNDGTFTDIEILRMENSRPKVTLFGCLSQMVTSHGKYRIMLSLSYDTDYVVAFASCEI